MDGDDWMTPPTDDYDEFKPPMGDGDFPDMGDGMPGMPGMGDGMGGTGMPDMGGMGDNVKPPFRRRRQNEGSPWPVEGCTKNTKCWASQIAKKYEGWEDSSATNLMCDIDTGFCVCKPGFSNADQDPFNGCEESEMPVMPV